MHRCFACDRRLIPNPYLADTRDSQFVYVGSECYSKIKRAGDTGYQPPKGGPRLWVLRTGYTQQQLNDIHAGRATELSHP